MRSWLGGLAAGGFAVALTVALGALSRAPYTADPGRDAVLRLAWRFRGDRFEICRRLTPDELARLPVHMRVEEECEGRVAPYRLEVVLDGVPSLTRTIVAAGARQDRPLYVFDNLPVEPGRHTVRLTFARATPAPGEREEVAHERREPEAEEIEEHATGHTATLDTALVLHAGRIVLITYDEERLRLVAREGP